MIRPAAGRDVGGELGCNPFDFQGLDAKWFQGERVSSGRIHVELGSRSLARIGLHHGNVDVFEDLARSDAEDAVEGLDEVVTFAPTMLTSQMIGKAEGRTELLGFDQEACAIRLPFLNFHGAVPKKQFPYLLLNESCCLGPCGTEQQRNFWCEGEGECTSEWRAGQFSIFGAIEENGEAESPETFCDRKGKKCDVNRPDGESFDVRADCQEKSGRVGAGISTECTQEMQKG
jgi:hypothetical protein